MKALTGLESRKTLLTQLKRFRQWYLRRLSVSF